MKIFDGSLHWNDFIMLLVFLPFISAIDSVVTLDQINQGPHLSSSEGSYITGVQGFGADIQCVINSCIQNSSRLKWYKDNELYSSGLSVQVPESKAKINHFVAFHPTVDCEGSICSEQYLCPDSQHCLQNSCCYCVKEEFTLVLKNLTLADSGVYRCQLDEGEEESLDFTFEVYESGIQPDFNKNLTLDHSECCKKQNMSGKCQPMCKPGELETHTFDPMDCDLEISKFLYCTTEGGNVSHTHCCRLQLVPPFCWDFCTGELTRLREAHHLCLFWLPEILECYEHAYLPLPDPPESVTVVALDTKRLKVCWEPPEEQGSGIKHYTVEYKEVPRFPFLGGSPSSSPFGNPFLGSRGSGAIDSALEMEQPVKAKREPRSQRVERYDSMAERYDSMAEDGGLSDWETSVTLENGAEGTMGIRRKRSTWVFFTHNGVTNQTRVKEFKFKKENTTEECHTIENLQPATQYIIYVTATNQNGTSLPSVRTVIATPAVLFKNGTLPNIGQCCKDNDVEPICIPKLCDLENTPSAFGALDIALNCRAEFSGVAPCLADGRDHVPCCRAKGVTGDCLKLCDGSATYLGLHSVLCLTMDMNAVYSCIRQGYVTHPSPPTNVTITEITSSSVTVTWDDPLSNPEHVRKVSLYFKRDDRPGEGFSEVDNVTSPYTLENLEPGVTYMLYLKAHGEDGSSLQSVVEEFDTISDEPKTACPNGNPLRSAEGAQLLCSPALPCPADYACIHIPGTEGDAECCPNKVVIPTILAPGMIPNVTECCIRRGMNERCQKLCSYNTTIDDLLINGANCIQHIGDWVDCGSDGRDHRPCCMSRGVPEVCLGFCRPPLRALNREHMLCLNHVQSILQCGAEGVKKLPGPPMNLRIVTMTPTYVTFAWDRPHQPQEPTHYTLMIYSQGRKVREENITGLSTEVGGLSAGTNYTGQLFARNEHGSSIGSNNVSFTAPGEIKSEADVPTTPHSLELEWNHLSSVNISWDWDGKSTAGYTLNNVGFKVYYYEVEDGVPVRWSEADTDNRWIVLNHLERQKTYKWRVIAVNKAAGNKESTQSETSTFKTVRSEHPPSLPVILVEPDKEHYSVGDAIKISCSSQGESVPIVTLFVPTVPDETRGEGSASINVTVSAAMGESMITCIAQNNAGKVARKTQSLQVVFGATVNKVISPVRVLDQLSAVFPCTVKGNPRPSVAWTFSQLENDESGKSLKNSENITMDMTGGRGAFTYDATLTINKVLRFNQGYYNCKACNSIGCQTATFHLIVQDLALPKGPKEVEECCRKENVKAECMSVCDFDLSRMKNSQTCLPDFPKLLHCARNGVDHSQCCVKKGVPQSCMGLCDIQGSMAASLTDLRTCGLYSQNVMECILERQQLIPSEPRDVEVTAYGERILEVKWKVPEQNGDSVQLYVVYYKGVKDTLYKLVKTNGTNVALKELLPNTTYEVTVLAANNRGVSQFSESQSITLRSRHRPARTAAGAILGIIFCMLLAAVIILAVVYFTRRRPYRIPAFFTKLRTGHMPRSDSVAFENPGYDREGQIRGLPGDTNLSDGEINGVNGSLNGHAMSNGNGHQWEKADLTSPNDNGSPTPLQRGLKYTQMST